MIVVCEAATISSKAVDLKSSYRAKPLAVNCKETFSRPSAVLSQGQRPIIKTTDSWDFPGGPAAKTLCSQCRGPGFNPWLGNLIPHAAAKARNSQINKKKKKTKQKRLILYPKKKKCCAKWKNETILFHHKD